MEATVDHQGKAKPLNFQEHRDRYDQWKDKIHYVVADDLYTAEEFPHAKNPWIREHAQREWIGKGLEELDADDNDIVFQSDADEFPTAVGARNVTPRGGSIIPLIQRPHFWAIDWLYKGGWQGTVVGRYGPIKHLADKRVGGPWAAMRDMRNSPTDVVSGWHFSWLGGTREAWMAKVNQFCHPEVEQRIIDKADTYFSQGVHVDGLPMVPVEVDKTWPKWMQDPANVPDSWRRPR